MEKEKENRSVSLIKPLVIVALVTITIAGLLYYFDPIRKFKKARDAERWEDVTSILSALRNYKSDKRNADLFKEIDGLYREDWYMIVGGPKIKGCDDSNEFSDVEVFDDNYCLDLSDLADKGYLGELPVSPEGELEWDKGLDDSSRGTGYAFMIDEEDIIHIQACESENTYEILISGKLK